MFFREEILPWFAYKELCSERKGYRHGEWIQTNRVRISYATTHVHCVLILSKYLNPHQFNFKPCEWRLERTNCIQSRGRTPPPICVLDMTLNFIWWWSSSSRDLGSVKHFFIAFILWSNLTWNGSSFYCRIFVLTHHHYHVVPLARIFLTLSRRFSQSFIASGKSSGLHPIPSHSCYMYARAVRPAFARPYVGVHRITSLMSSSLHVWFV